MSAKEPVPTASANFSSCLLATDFITLLSYGKMPSMAFPAKRELILAICICLHRASQQETLNIK